MKRTILITTLFLGFSVVGFSQTTDVNHHGDGVNEVVVTGKQQVSATEHVYRVKDCQGLDYESLPTQAQKAIGEHATLLVAQADNIGPDMVNSTCPLQAKWSDAEEVLLIPMSIRY